MACNIVHVERPRSSTSGGQSVGDDALEIVVGAAVAVARAEAGFVLLIIDIHAIEDVH